MNWCALSDPFMWKLKVHLGKQISFMFLAALGTDLLCRKHVLSHEVFDLLENSLTFSCLPEQSIFCRTCGRPVARNISHVKKSKGLSEAAAGCQIPSVAGLSLVSGRNQFVKPTITMNLDNNLLITEFLPGQTL